MIKLTFIFFFKVLYEALGKPAQVELFCHLPRIHRQHRSCFPKSEEQSRHDANIIVLRGEEEEKEEKRKKVIISLDVCLQEGEKMKIHWFFL